MRGPALTPSPPPPPRSAARGRTSHPDPRGTPPTPARRWPRRSPRAIASPRPAPPTPLVDDPRWNGSKMRLELRRGDAPSAVDHPDDHLARGVGDMDGHSLVLRRVLDGVLHEVDERTLDLVEVGAHRRRLVGKRDVDPRSGIPELPKRVPDEILDRAHLGLGRAAPAWSRDRSSRLATRPSSRAASAEMVASSSRRSSGSSSRSSRARADAAVRIAMSGERRSWLTARRSAVFIASRSPERLGLERLAGQPFAVDGDAEQRRERRDQPPPGGRSAPPRIVEVDDADAPCAGDERVGGAVRPACPGRARSAPGRPGGRGRPRRRSAPARRAPRRGPGARSRSRPGARTRSRRLRDRAASSLTTTAVTTNTASANQLRESASVNVCTGGRKNQLKASIEAIATPIPNRVPHRTAIGRTAKM